jgi:diguanylate cyclase (GGDEF)-like protein
MSAEVSGSVGSTAVGGVRHASPVADRDPRRGQPGEWLQRRLRRSWWWLVGSFVALAALIGLRVLFGERSPFDWLLALLVVAVGLAGTLHQRVLSELEEGRRLESESFARILRGLSRSVSPDAIVDAIVEDLGVATGADHTVVVRLRADARILEATLVSSRAGVPTSTTMLPLSDLDDPGPGSRSGRGRREPVAVPIEAGPVAVGMGRTATSAAGAGMLGASAARATINPVNRDRPFEDWDGVARATAGSVASTVPFSVGSAGVGGGGAGGVATRTSPVDSAAAARIAQRVATRVAAVYGLKNTLAAPLVTGQRVVGAIVLSRRTTEAWDAAASRFVQGAAVEAAAALARAYSHREAEAAASTDALTGLPNRRYFDEFCGLLARRRRSDDAVGVLMIDIDHFKRLNDQFGHAVGDQVLRAVAGAIVGAVREGDVPARFGGEEFAVLLRNPGPGVAMEVGERVRVSVAMLDLSAFGPAGVTVSVGAVVAHAADQPISQLLEDADHALYRAKRLGRNQVVAA